MLQVYWYGKVRYGAGSVWLTDTNSAFAIYNAMKRSKWKCFVLSHYAHSEPHVYEGKEDYEEWKEL